MSGGTPEHAALEAAIAGELRSALARPGKPCRIYFGEPPCAGRGDRLRVLPGRERRVREAGDEPCRSSRGDEPHGRRRGAERLVGVLRPRAKARHYRRIPSIRECVLVSQHSPLVEVWRRNEQDRWKVAAVAGSGESADLASLGIVVDVDALYRQPPEELD